MASTETAKLKTKAKASLTLLLVAVISITTATYAWFTMSNSTTVQNMEVKVGTGAKLEVCTTETGTYAADLDNATINAAMVKNGANPGIWGFSYIKGLEDIRLWPLSSGDGERLYTQTANGSDGAPTTGGKGYYLELPLWFRASTDMDVYLNAESFANETNGTKIVSYKDKAKPELADGQVHKAMRLSITEKHDPLVPITKAFIFEPERPTNPDVPTTLAGKASATNPFAPKTTQDTFRILGTNAGLKSGEGATPVLFSLAKDTAKQVTLRIWIEGEDPECKNNTTINIEKQFLNVRLRFCGADKDGNYIEADQE